METTPFYPTDQEKSIRDTLRQELGLPATLQPRHYDFNEIVPGIREMISELGISSRFWEDVALLLRRKSVHVQEYAIPAEQRVIFTAMSSYYSPQSLADYMQIEVSTGHKIQQEVGAAIVFLKGKNNLFLKYDQLGVEGKEAYETFNKVKDKQEEAHHILHHANMRRELDSVPPFRWLTQEQAREGSILFYLDQLGLQYEHPVNIANTFSRFLSEGYLQGGNLTLMRRVLYANRLANPGSFNTQRQKIQDLMQRAAGRVFSITPEKDRRTGTLKRNIRDFLRYATADDFIHNLNNYDMLDNLLKERHQLHKVGRKGAYGGTTVLIPDSDLTSEAQQQLRDFRCPQGYKVGIDSAAFFTQSPGSDSTALIDRFLMRFMQAESRSPVIEHIAATLQITPESARKVYNAGLTFSEWVLMTNSRSGSDLFADIRHNNVSSGYERIKQKLLSIHSQ